MEPLSPIDRPSPVSHPKTILDLLGAAPQPSDRLIVALDQPSRTTALEMAAELQGVCLWLKVGLELYLAAGQQVVDDLTRQGFRIFLDLKLHDIPNTVVGAVRSLSASGAELLTVHATGGPNMLTAAAEAAAGIPHAPHLLAVTVLTSMDTAQLAAIGITAPPGTEVLRLARMAAACGITGLVCSPEEAGLLRKELGPESANGPLLVTPGIRPSGTDVPVVAVANEDQKRIATPASAIAAGASMLVVGRPITQAEDPAKAAEAILKEIASAKS